MTQLRRSPAVLTALLSLSLLTVAHAQGKEGQLSIMQSEPPRSMDPADQTATFTGNVLAPVYEGLTRFNKALEIEPLLATKWSVNKAGTEWTFTLRSGVQFQDGTPFNAAAVVTSFGRQLDEKRGLAASGRFRTVIDKVTAINPTTVRFTLKKPYPAFPSLMSGNAAFIVSPAADKKGTLGRQPVGTGPYSFVEWKSGEYVLEKANPKYWGKQPGIPSLKWTWTSEPSVMNLAIQSGQADLVNPLPPIFTQVLKNNPKVTLLQGKGASVFWLSLNVKLKPLNDVRVRQALNYATDQKALVATLLRGYGEPANSPLAPADFGYDPAAPGYPYDVAKAKKLLSDAGYPNGVTVSVASQEPDSSIVQALQGMWAKAGITLKIMQMESGVWSEAAFGTPEQKAKAGINSSFASWSAGTLDADGQLSPLYATSSASPAGANLGFYSNPKLDALLTQGSAETDTAKRKTIYAQAQRIISQDAAHVLLYYPSDIAAVRSTVKGVWIFPGGGIRLEDATMDK